MCSQHNVRQQLVSIKRTRQGVLSKSPENTRTGVLVDGPCPCNAWGIVVTLAIVPTANSFPTTLPSSLFGISIRLRATQNVSC